MAAISYSLLLRLTLLFLLQGMLSVIAYPTKLDTDYLGRSGHHNKGLVNATGYPIELEFTRGENLLINAYGSNYKFTDMVSLEQFIFAADQPSIPDDDYFRFSEENLVASEHALFYARWTISAQADPEYKSLGEDALFVRQFTANYDFRCGFASTCLNLLSRYEIQDMFHDKRPLARLVYFQLTKYAMLHDMAVGTHNVMSDAQQYVTGHIHDIITSFTRQPDATKAQICAISKEVIQSLVTYGVNMGLTYAGIPTDWQFIIGNAQLWADAILRIKNAEPTTYKFDWKKGQFNSWWEGVQANATLQKDLGLEGAKAMSFNFDISSTVRDQVAAWVLSTGFQHYSKLTKDIMLDQGYGKSLVCGGYEGDEADRNKANKNKLAKHFSGYFDELKGNVREQYRSMLKGTLLIDGNYYPTLLGLLGMNMKWAGEGSVLETVQNMEPTRLAIMSEIERKIISDVVRNDGNWASCSQRQDAQAMCERAQRARETNSKDVTDAVKGQFCPDASDPTLICSTGRWYHHKFHSHVVPFAPLKAFNNYHSPYFNLTFEEAMVESYANYKRVGNDMTTDTRGWSLGHVRGGGMRVPFCVNKYNQITDFGGYIMPHLRPKLQWEFPSICGDQGAQTEEFLASISLGKGSQSWRTTEDFGKAMQLYRDRIPRVLNRLSPYLSYMQYGRIGIQFPIHREYLNLTSGTAAAHATEALLASNSSATTEDIEKAAIEAQDEVKDDPRWALMNRWKVFAGVDLDFELVRDATVGSGKTEFGNNLWFCGEEGQKIHTIFKRERGHIDLGTHPTGRIDSHNKKCKKWLAAHQVEIQAGEHS